jgi:hypothetical protein
LVEEKDSDGWLSLAEERAFELARDDGGTGVESTNQLGIGYKRSGVKLNIGTSQGRRLLHERAPRGISESSFHQLVPEFVICVTYAWLTE